MKKIIPIFVLLVLILLIVFEFNLYKSKKLPGSCGGDFQYRVKCPIGSYCKPSTPGPMAGGSCQTFLSPIFKTLGL